MIADPQFTLSESHAGFIESGVRIVAASRDEQNRPLLGHVVGCRVAPDRRRVTIFLPRWKYPHLLDAIRRTGIIAVGFTESSSNKGIQLKGTGATLAAIESGDRERIATYLDLFTADLDRIGSRGELARTALGCAISDVAAVAFPPISAFIQTPGPLAGSRIGA